MKRINRRAGINHGRTSSNPPPVVRPRKSHPGVLAFQRRSSSNQGHLVDEQPVAPVIPGVAMMELTHVLLQSFDEAVEQQFRWINEVVMEARNVLAM